MCLHFSGIIYSLWKARQWSTFIIARCSSLACSSLLDALCCNLQEKFKNGFRQLFRRCPCHVICGRQSENEFTMYVRADTRHATTHSRARGHTPSPWTKAYQPDTHRQRLPNWAHVSTGSERHMTGGRMSIDIKVATYWLLHVCVLACSHASGGGKEFDIKMEIDKYLHLPLGWQVFIVTELF